MIFLTFSIRFSDSTDFDEISIGALNEILKISIMHHCQVIVLSIHLKLQSFKDSVQLGRSEIVLFLFQASFFSQVMSYPKRQYFETYSYDKNKHQKTVIDANYFVFP